MSERTASRLAWVIGAAVTVATIDVVSAGHGVADVVDALSSAGDVADVAGLADVADAASSAGTVPAGPVHFGATVDFPDGTSIDNPHQDALGYVYQTHDDYVGGVNRHVLGD